MDNPMLRKVLVEVTRVQEGFLGIVYDFLTKLNNDKTGEFLTQFKKFLRGEMVERAISYITDTFTVTVDETVSVEDAVKAGKFDWSNDSITSANFPKLANGQKSNKEITLFHFNKMMSSEAVIAEMDKAGYKPATIWDLLSLGASQPDLQRKFPIVAPGSVCGLDGDRRVPSLYEFSSERRLGLDCLGYDWPGNYRFLAVRK